MTDGNPVNALYGFCRFLGDFMEQVNPEYVAVLFDESLSESFRTEIYPEYKANRDPAPPELKRQFGAMSSLCTRARRSGVGQPEVRGGRPDRYACRPWTYTTAPSTIVTRDKDLAQLLSADDIFWDFAGKGKIAYEQVSGVFGVPPEQIADFLALAGDAVDNIKGVPGVGKKTAARLLENFGSLDGIYDNLEPSARNQRTRREDAGRQT